MERSKNLQAVMTIAIFIAGAFAVAALGQSQPQNQSQHAICDADGDGICDTCGQPAGSGRMNAQGNQAKKGKHWGPGDGLGNQGIGPQDGTGYGAQSGKGFGVKDGTGPYHQSGGQHRGQGAGGRGGRF